MKIFLILFLSLSAMADCGVLIPEKTFYHLSGYSIEFDFTEILSKKKFYEVNDALASHKLLIVGIEQPGTFHRAVGIIEFQTPKGKITAEESVLCLTQYCGISDYGKAFQKSYNKLSKRIPSCEE